MNARILSTLFTLLLALSFAAPDCAAQSAGRMQRKRPPAARKATAPVALQVPVALRDSFVVFPEAKPFGSLEAALEYCRRKPQPLGNKKTRAVYVPAGTHYGNWVIPPAVSIHGDGMNFTILIGVQGVSKPTLTYTVPPGTTSWNHISSMAIVGVGGPAFDFSGTAADAGVSLISVEVRATKAIPNPAIRVTGSGVGTDQKLVLDLDEDWCLIESMAGNAVEASIGPYVELDFDDCDIEAALAGFDITCPNSQGTQVELEDVYIGNCQTSIKATSLDELQIFDSVVEASVDCLSLSATNLLAYRSDFLGPGTGNGVLASNGSTVQAGYCGFIQLQQGFNVDGSSTLKNAFCHLDFVPIP